jgi:hypothetical protein
MVKQLIMEHTKIGSKNGFNLNKITYKIINLIVLFFKILYKYSIFFLFLFYIIKNKINKSSQRINYFCIMYTLKEEHTFDDVDIVDDAFIYKFIN